MDDDAQVAFVDAEPEGFRRHHQPESIVHKILLRSVSIFCTHFPVIKTDRQTRLPQPLGQCLRFADCRDIYQTGSVLQPTRRQFHQTTILLAFIDGAANLIDEIVSIVAEIDDCGPRDVQLSQDIARDVGSGRRGERKDRRFSKGRTASRIDRYDRVLLAWTKSRDAEALLGLAKIVRGSAKRQVRHRSIYVIGPETK